MESTDWMWTELSMDLFLAFLAFWFGGAAIMSRAAGWHAISSLYPAQPITGEHFRFTTASLGNQNFPITYRRCIRLVMSQDGIYMRLMFPFRFYSPAFFLPWSAIETCFEKQVIGGCKYIFSIKAVNQQITLSGPLGKTIETAYLAAAAGAA